MLDVNVPDVTLDGRVAKCRRKGRCIGGVPVLYSTEHDGTTRIIAFIILLAILSSSMSSSVGGASAPMDTANKKN